ncbi:MAG: hypothetical protein JNM74_25490 [Myxococcales bacterium]|nr:hypothetical protein [Myxococcales bacterium]
MGDTGCAREPTAVILAVTTDMSVIQDLDEVGLFVGVNGEVKSSLRTFVSTEVAAKLPGTVSILEPEEANKPVHVRVAGYKNGQLKVVRDAIVTVPPKALTVLRMPLGWLSATQKRPAAGGTSGTARAGQVKPKALTEEEASFKEFDAFFPGYVSPCATGETSDDGACITVLAEAQVTTYGDLVRDVFGGSVSLNEATGVAEGGVCFDMEACFKNEQTLKVTDYPECKVTIPESIGNTVNFALVRNLASGCDGYECFVPLDADKRWDAQARVYTLPREACERVKSADPAVKVERIAVATACERKYEATPRCNGLYGAVRDKAPSDPNRPRYYKEEPPNPPPPTGDGGVPEGGTPDGGDAGPKLPTLLGRLTQLQNPRKLAVANDRVWVRGRIGMAFLDGRGVSTPTEVSPLPTDQGAVDDGGGYPDIAAAGNGACAVSLIQSKAWCYDLTTRGYTASSAVTGVVSFGGRVAVLETSFARPPAATLATPPRGVLKVVQPAGDMPANVLGDSGGIEGVSVGAATTPSGRALVAMTPSPGTDGFVRLSAGPVASGTDVTSSVLMTIPGSATTVVGMTFPVMVMAATNSEAFVAIPAPDAASATLHRRAFADAAPTEPAAMPGVTLPYVLGELSPSVVVDDAYVYWGGGAQGPMAVSTCTRRAVTPKALFPSAGAQNNTTYAVARSGNKLFFATDDGRVYSMDPPAPEPCP